MGKSNPIRVAHIIGRLSYGGVEAVVFNYYRNIDKSKYQFDFYYDDDSPVSPPADLIKMGANFFAVPSYKKLNKYLKTLQKLFEQNRYKIVHSHMNTLSVFPLRAAKKAGVKIRIAHNHSVAGKGETKKNILKYALRPLAKVYPTHLVACSNYAGKWLFGKKSKFTVFNNAIEVEKFLFNVEKRKEMRNNLKVDQNFVVGHVGRFCFAKNHEFLIDIFREYSLVNKDAILLLIGEGENLITVKEKVEQLGLQEKVMFVGSVNNVEDYYQAIDIFALPSRYEGLPVVGVEAQISGIPCLFSDAMTKETKFVETTEFMCLNQSPKEWAEKIEEMKALERKSDIEYIEKSGFDIKIEARKMEKFYKNVCEKP